MSDEVLFGVALVLVIAVPFDIYVAWRFTKAALVRPHDDVATGIALTLACIAIAATCAGVLGVHTIRFLKTGDRLIPQGLSILLIAIAVVVVSVPSAYWIRKIREWRRRPQLHVHRRGDDLPRWHRRFDDPPIGPGGDTER